MEISCEIWSWHTHTHIHTYTHTHTHTYTRTHIHTHTHTSVGCVDPRTKRLWLWRRWRMLKTANICASGTHKCQKRPTNVKRDLLWKEKRPTMEGKETYYGRKRDLLWEEKRPTMETANICASRYAQMSKETHKCQTDLLWKEKRPTMAGKETYGRKRDLLWKEKRPTMEGKETYYERQKE